MSYNESRTHAYMNLLAVEFGLYQFLRLFRDRFQTVNEERCDARYKLHYCTHGDTEEQYLLDIEFGSHTDKGTHDNTQDKRLTQYTELLLQSVCVNVEFGETGNHVEHLVYEDSKRHETLAEGLGNGDTVEVVIFLELLCREIRTHQRNNIAHDGSKVSPHQALAHNEISDSPYESEVPVIPQVDVDSACRLGNEHQQIHA